MSSAQRLPGVTRAGDLGQAQVHRLGVAPGQDQAGGSACFRADCAEDVTGRRALVLWRGRAGAAFGPMTDNLVLLSDSGLIAEPDLYIVRLDAGGAPDRGCEAELATALTDQMQNTEVAGKIRPRPRFCSN
jgi:hypothetical protein